MYKQEKLEEIMKIINDLTASSFPFFLIFFLVSHLPIHGGFLWFCFFKLAVDCFDGLVLFLPYNIKIL